MHHGDLYPFTLADKLATMTEHLAVHDPDRGSTTPWGCAVVPVEMLSVLANRGSKSAGFEVRQPSLDDVFFALTGSARPGAAERRSEGVRA